MPQSNENITRTRHTLRDQADDYEVILSTNKSPRKSEDDKTQYNLEENKMEDNFEDISSNL